MLKLALSAVAIVVVLASQAAAQETAQAPWGPLFRIPHADIHSWMSAPEPLPDGRIRVWHWGITPAIEGGSDGANIYPFLEELDCAAGTTARLRSEWYADDRFLRAFPRSVHHRVPSELFMESRLLEVVCRNEPVGRRVETPLEALRLVLAAD